MTDHDWLAGSDLGDMVRWVEAHASPRKRILADCSQARRLGPLVGPALAPVLDARERFADGRATEADLRPFLHVLDEAAAKTRDKLNRADREYDEARRAGPDSHPDDAPYPTAPLIAGAECLRAQQAAQEAAVACMAVEAVRVAAFGSEDELDSLSRLRNLVDEIGEHQAEASALAELAANWENRAEELAEQFGRYPRRKRQIAAEAQEWVERGGSILDGMMAKRLRDAATRTRRAFVRTLHGLFGNPFGPVTFDPRWKTADVVELARAIHDEQAFERLPVLADALMDAGCDEPAVIAHCREPGAHYRGCWVIDAVLDLEAGPAARA